ncbi:MAG: ABC transporter permease [Balneolaceae bacterium]|nr:ABC transporter permease [Balneolaceae bacterium]MBO6546996.1 ABC transporter permease [Balneolaceae bacterium]MBO6649356.1 ABC transporter permease [Balneolaceae bacterium]
MESFNLETNISNWKRKLFQKQNLEPGDIEELENHLRDSIEALISNGVNPKEAFEKSVAKMESGFDEALEEYKFSSATHEPKSKWLSSWWIPELLPNILKVFLRNLKRQPGYSFINISGLAIGMACCMIIFLFVQNELSYDTFHEKSDRIFRVDQTLIWNDFDGLFSSTGPGVAATLKADFPEIETTVRINNLPDQLITIQSSGNSIRYFEEDQILAADSTFFEVFTMDFLEGNPDNALVNPYSIILTEETKSRYFQNNESALGKTVTIGNPGQQVDYMVTGVVDEMPSNSHFTFDLLTTLSSNPRVKQRENTWIWTVFVTYLVLEENTDLASFQEKVNQKAPDYAKSNIFPLFGDEVEAAKKYELFITPLREIYLDINQAGNRIGSVSDYFYIFVFSSIALIIILLAAINFMNLSSARSAHRAKEVGIRKTLGSQKTSLISQFLSESILFSTISMFLALGIVYLCMPFFNIIAAKELTFSDLLTGINLLQIIGLTLATGLLAGIYPALYLTSFNPIEAFKGKISSLTNNKFSFNGLRNSLVVFQFAISIMLISCSVIIYQQLNFLQNKSLGFDKNNVLVIENVEKLDDQIETFKQMIEQKSGVVNVTKTNAVPPQIWHEDFATVYGGDGNSVPLNSLNVDSDFISTYDLEIVQGREFEKESSANQRYVVLNETALDHLNWTDGSSGNPDFPLGESILFSGLDTQYEIIGVVKDFNLTSLHYNIQPLAIFHDESTVWKGDNRFLSVRTSEGANLMALINSVENEWTQISGGLPFDFTFLDDQLASQYEFEQRVSSLVTIFTGLAIFIALLGLLGLVSFAIEKRTKEIGVRKVMGASSSRIVFLLSKDTLKLVLIAIIISIPVSWYLMENWLQNFVFRVEINPVIFILSGVFAILLAWAVLSYQTIKASVQNPVKSLKSE